VQTVELSPDGTRLFFGGHFGTRTREQTVCGNRVLSGLASVNPATGAIYCDWVPQLAPSTNNGNGAWDMSDTGEALWVGGGFTEVTGGVPPTTVTQPNIARFDYDATLEPNFAVPQVDLNGLSSGGLDATYFDNINFTGTQVSRTDATINFDWGSGSPHPSIGSDTFSARWTGQIEAPASGVYTFTTTSDDGVRLFVDGMTVVENWTDHGPTDNSGTMTLEAGRRYDIQLDFYENGGGAVAKLQWGFLGQLRQIIPSANLFYPGGIDYSATFTSGTGPTPIVDPGKLTVTDADDTSLKSAKVTLTDRPDGTAERLSADAAGTAIAVSYDAQTGVLSLQGPATKDAFRQVLGTVKYDNTSASPTAGERRVTFVVNDGSVDSKAATSTVLSVDTTPPTISSVAPANGQTDVALDANVEATFSEEMDAASVTDPANFTLTKQDGTPEGTQVPATLSYNSSTKKATLDPNADLDPQSSYTATIKGGTDGVKDSSGNPLASDEVWSFTTTLPCTISGTPSAETITGTSGDDVICAGAGNDTIKALEGNDTIKGEGGADQLYGELGDDDLDGGLGTDTANFSGSLASISASLADGTATGEGSDSFTNVENLFGSNLADTLTGSATNNTLNGAGGADSIVGLGGSDALKGSGGGDTLDSRDGVEGNDALDGGTGTDTCLSDATEKSVVGCEL
jgi:Ca2+-binding RTX toxin-like protein